LTALDTTVDGVKTRADKRLISLIALIAH